MLGDMSFCGMLSLSLLMLVLVGKDGYHLRGRRSFSRQEFDGIPALPPLDYYMYLLGTLTYEIRGQDISHIKRQL